MVIASVTFKGNQAGLRRPVFRYKFAPKNLLNGFSIDLLDGFGRALYQLQPNSKIDYKKNKSETDLESLYFYATLLEDYMFEMNWEDLNIKEIG